MNIRNVFAKLSTEDLRVLVNSEHSEICSELHARTVKRYYDGNCIAPTKQEREWFETAEEFLPDYLRCPEYTTYHVMAQHKYSERVGMPLSEAYWVLSADRDKPREEKSA